MATINNLLPTSPLHPDNVNIIDQNFTNLNNDKIEENSVDTLTNKSIDLGNNTLTGTLEQFNIAITDGDIASEQEVSNGDYIIKADGTKAYFSFDGTDYDFADNTVSNNAPFKEDNTDGTLTNFTRNDGTVSGGVSIEGEAMKFDGVNGTTVNTGTGLNTVINGGQVFSIFAKIKDTSIIGDVTNHIIASSNGVVSTRTNLITASLDGTFRVYIGGTIISSGVNVRDGSEHIVGVSVYDDAGTKKVNLFVDNTQVVTGATAGTNTHTSDVQIGSLSTTEVFDGNIEWIRVWNTATTLSEFQAEASSNYAVKSDGLIAQYSGRNFAGTTASPSTIYDTNMIGQVGDRQVLFFDGVNNFVSFPAGLFADYKDKTVVFRNKFIKNNLLKFFISHPQITGNNRFYINKSTTNDIRYQIGSLGGEIIPSASYNDGDILDLIILHSPLNKTAKFYINGTFIKTVTTDVGTATSTNTFIGAANGSGTDAMIMDTFDFGIVNRLWSEEEIKAYSLRSARLFSDVSGVSGDLGVSGKTTTDKLNIRTIHTSATGLVSGDVWNDAGTLKIVT